MHTLFNLFRQVVAGNLPLIPVRPVVWATALPDPIQRLGSGLWANGVVDGGVLLPPAAFDWNCHADSHILHQKGTLEHGQSVTRDTRRMVLVMVFLKFTLICGDANS